MPDAPPIVLREPARRPSIPTCRVIERIEAESAFSQHRCAPPVEARRLAMRSERIGSATVVLTKSSANLYYNRWIAAGQAGAATEEQLDRFLGLARAHGVASVGVNLSPGTRPSAAGRWLTERGFTRCQPGAKLWRDASPLVRLPRPLGISVRRVAQTEAGVWVDVVSKVWRTFGSRRPWFEARATTPGWTHYLAWHGDEPVGAGALFIGLVGATPAGHLVDGVTLPQWRRRGVQTAMIRKRVSEGRRRGCTVFASETAPPLPRMPLVSFRNLRRQGFELAYLRESWRLDFE